MGPAVIPAELRRLAGFHEGEELVAAYGSGVLRLVSRRELARAGRGMFADLAPGRDLIGELLSERRDETRRESGDGSPRSAGQPG